MTARERAVAVMAEALLQKLGHPGWCDYDAKTEEGCTPEFGCNIWRHTRHLAEAAVAALEQEMGLIEEAAVHPVSVEKIPLEMIPVGWNEERPATEFHWLPRTRLTTDWSSEGPE